jgi:hypothetical protein
MQCNEGQRNLALFYWRMADRDYIKITSLRCASLLSAALCSAPLLIASLRYERARGNLALFYCTMAPPIYIVITSHRSSARRFSPEFRAMLRYDGAGEML